MAESKYSTPARRMGAKAAVAALAKIDDSIANAEEGLYTAIDPGEVAYILIEGAGEKLSSKMEGYLAALAEYVAGCMEIGGILDASKWRPIAAMTGEEVEAERAKVASIMGLH